MSRKCFNKKNQHIGELVKLRRYDLGWNEEAVVRWCPECGAIVIDKESDGRTLPGKMMFPKILWEKKSKPTQRIHKSLLEEEWKIKK